MHSSIEMHGSRQVSCVDSNSPQTYICAGGSFVNELVRAIQLIHTLLKRYSMIEKYSLLFCFSNK